MPQFLLPETEKLYEKFCGQGKKLAEKIQHQHEKKAQELRKQVKTSRDDLAAKICDAKTEAKKELLRRQEQKILELEKKAAVLSDKEFWFAATQYMLPEEFDLENSTDYKRYPTIADWAESKARRVEQNKILTKGSIIQQTFGTMPRYLIEYPGGKGFFICAVLDEIGKKTEVIWMTDSVKQMNDDELRLVDFSLSQ
ncbi:MAG: hypothetical protein WC310_04680 [Patescibacteria group bacterium]